VVSGNGATTDWLDDEPAQLVAALGLQKR
jgi:hypothetical protein